jgi:hypothetical protein
MRVASDDRGMAYETAQQEIVVVGGFDGRQRLGGDETQLVRCRDAGLGHVPVAIAYSEVIIALLIDSLL